MRFFTSSIYRVLQVLLSLLFLASLLFAGYQTLHVAGRQINRDYDHQLISDSYVIWTLIREELLEENDLHEMEELMENSSIDEQEWHELKEFNAHKAFRVWHGDALALRSASAYASDVAAVPPGFSNLSIGKERWRVYSMYLPQKHLSVEVWENEKLRERLLHRIVRNIVEVAVLAIPVLWILLLISIRYGLRGLQRMTQELEARNPDSLERLDIPHLPQELEPLTRSINNLIERVKSSLEHERLFMDSTAHEIRTPLATLSLQGQLITCAPNEEERNKAIAALLESLNRTTHLANQLLLLSRVEQQSLAFSPTAVTPLARRALAERALLAAGKAIDLSLEGEEEASFTTNGELLEILLGIFLDNSIHYTPSGGSVRIRIEPQRILIEDSGGGIAEEDIGRVFEKFYRGSTSGATRKGSGLGLSIAAEIARRLHIRITLENIAEPAGLRVVLEFL